MPTFFESRRNPARLWFLMGLFILMGLTSFSQVYELNGKILDNNTGKPVPYATVYINGTSTGTITDEEGNFFLQRVRIPCELIVSHVSYQVRRVPLQDPSILNKLQFSLDLKVVMLQEATIIRKQLREEYIERFKTWFLGREYKKYRADILNDSILIFNISEDDQFSVSAYEPIIVHLPHTGYTLNVDLVKFDLQYKEEYGGYHCSILGYYYFEPIDQDSPRKQRNVARNRVEHYYNSVMHFCRSLYHNSLAENGYEFYRACLPDESDDPYVHVKPDFVASSTTDQFGNQHLLLTNFACRNFKITFYFNARNRPVDLTYLDSSPIRVWWTGLSFLKDTIRIYPSGRIPDNSILFSKTMAMKGVTSMLPEDYIPAMR